jgi:hypothetical protein
MGNENFKKQLNQIKELLNIENDKLGGNDFSYMTLLNIFSTITSIDDLKYEADKILYFLVDSYLGNKDVGNEISHFVFPYCSSDRNKKKKK